MTKTILSDFPYLGRLLFDSSTFYLAVLARRVAGDINWGDWQPDKPTVLCLECALFAKDIAELKKRTHLNLPCISVVVVKKPQERWVSPRLRQQSYFWYDLNARPLLKARLEQFGILFLKAALAIHPIDAVAAANTDYWQDEALRLACRKLKIPFIVLSRESYGIGRGREFVANNYKKANFYFNGAGCAVASEVCRQFMINQPAMRDAKVCATGWPRYDAWRDYIVPPLADRKFITLMAYGDPAQLQYAAENFRDVLYSFVACAERQLALPHHERLEFIIKMKKNNEDGYIRALCPNLEQLGIKVLADTPLPEICTGSRMIIGFNTLAVLEGLLANCAVVVPIWKDSERDPSASLLHPNNVMDAEVCYFPRSVTELENLFRQAEAGNLSAKADVKLSLARFSQHSLIDAETTASAQFEKFVRHIISAQR